MSAPNELSFLPDDYLERKQGRRVNIICAALFIIEMAGIGFAFMRSEASTRDLEESHTRIESEYTGAATDIEHFQQMQDKQKKMAHQAELTASLLEKVPRSFILAEITNSLPSGVSLVDFNLESRPHVGNLVNTSSKTAFEQKRAQLDAANNPLGSMPAAEVKTYDVTMKISGLAANDVQVAQLLTRLSRSALFDDVNLLISDEFEQDKQKVRKFSVEMTLLPNADVQAITPTQATTSLELTK